MILGDALLQACIIVINPETYPISPVSPFFKLSFLRLKAVRRFDIPISSPSTPFVILFHKLKKLGRKWVDPYRFLPDFYQASCIVYYIYKVVEGENPLSALFFI